MGCRFLPTLLASLALGIALPMPVAAQAPEIVPPWGRELGGLSSVSAQEPHREPAEPVETATTENGKEEHRPLFWVEAEYLLWFTRNGGVPPLLTRGQTTAPIPGAVGQIGTKYLYGGSIDFKDRSGGRFTAGMPLGDGPFGIEATYFFLSARDTGTFATSPGDPVLARPFYDVVNNREDASLVTYPGVLKGAIDIKTSSFMHNGEVNLSATIWQCEKKRVTLLGGFRYMNLNEELKILESSVGDVGAMQFFGANFLISDRFAVDNDFYGGQLGMRAEFPLGPVDVGLVAKVALGDSHEALTVAGQTTVTGPIPINAPAGLYALASNSGNFNRDRLAVVPEVGVRIGLNITKRLSVFAGYAFIYWSDVMRPGEQIDRGLNPNLIPTSLTYGAPGGPVRPAPLLHSTGFYAHGLDLGLTFRY